MPARSIKQVLKDHTGALMSLPGVVGTAEGLVDDKPCIKVYVAKKTPQLEQMIPESLEGFPLVVQETGEIKSLGAPD